MTLLLAPRPLKRLIQTLILDELALDIIEGKIKDGDKISINLGIKDQSGIKS
jgi:ATP-dependent Clp protease ATP-binding subunit ClpA